MSTPLEATRHHISSQLLVLLHPRAIYFSTFQYETPCNNPIANISLCELRRLKWNYECYFTKVRFQQFSPIVIMSNQVRSIMHRSKYVSIFPIGTMNQDAKQDELVGQYSKAIIFLLCIIIFFFIIQLSFYWVEFVSTWIPHNLKLQQSLYRHVGVKFVESSRVNSSIKGFCP